MATIAQPINLVRVLSNPVRRTLGAVTKTPFSSQKLEPLSCPRLQRPAALTDVNPQLIAQLSEVGDVEAPTWIIFAVYVLLADLHEPVAQACCRLLKLIAAVCGIPQLTSMLMTDLDDAGLL